MKNKFKDFSTLKLTVVILQHFLLPTYIEHAASMTSKYITSSYTRHPVVLRHSFSHNNHIFCIRWNGLILNQSWLIEFIKFLVSSKIVIIFEELFRLKIKIDKNIRVDFIPWKHEKKIKMIPFQFAKSLRSRAN